MLYETRVQKLQFHLRNFILAQEVDGSLWFLILAALGTLSKTLSALLVSQHGSSRASWSSTQAETVVVKLIFLHFYLICGELSHEWVGRHTVVVIFVNRNPIEVHEHSAGEVTALVASQIRITLDDETQAADPWIYSSVFLQLSSGDQSQTSSHSLSCLPGCYHLWMIL